LNSRQVQTQVLYYLNYRLQPIGSQPTILILPDTPWFLMVRIEGDLWETKCDYLSTGIGIWDVWGYNGKKASECNRKEIAMECWDQIKKSKHNLKIPQFMPKWDIWHSFNYNTYTQKMDTWEPKFSNNVNTLKYRPNFKDDKIKNLYHANAYTKTDMNIYNMESGVEAGVKTAYLIQGKPLEKKSVNLIFRIIRWFDKLVYIFKCHKN
jgi:hypothetical protein